MNNKNATIILIYKFFMLTTTHSFFFLTNGFQNKYLTLILIINFDSPHSLVRASFARASLAPASLIHGGQSDSYTLRRKENVSDLCVIFNRKKYSTLPKPARIPVDFKINSVGVIPVNETIFTNQISRILKEMELENVTQTYHRMENP